MGALKHSKASRGFKYIKQRGGCADTKKVHVEIPLPEHMALKVGERENTQRKNSIWKYPIAKTLIHPKVTHSYRMID